jgi:hypothetical protein
VLSLTLGTRRTRILRVTIGVEDKHLGCKLIHPRAMLLVILGVDEPPEDPSVREYNIKEPQEQLHCVFLCPEGESESIAFAPQLIVAIDTVKVSIEHHCCGWCSDGETPFASLGANYLTSGGGGGGHRQADDTFILPDDAGDAPVIVGGNLKGSSVFQFGFRLAPPSELVLRKEAQCRRRGNVAHLHGDAVLHEEYTHSTGR